MNFIGFILVIGGHYSSAYLIYVIRDSFDEQHKKCLHSLCDLYSKYRKNF